jgi:hypothetical protein
LDAVPLFLDDFKNASKPTLVFDAERSWNGFSSYDATLYMFENYAHQTKTMSKMGPGYNFSSQVGKPTLIIHPT